MAITSVVGRSRSFCRSWGKSLLVGGFLIKTILVILVLQSHFGRTTKRDSIPTEGASHTSRRWSRGISDDDNGEWIFDKNLSQNDSKLVQFTVKKFLDPPSPLKYNLISPLGDPAAKEKQNLYALKLLKGMRNGFFIECGASNGEHLSSTLVLERDHGWTGLLIEPEPANYAVLLSKHRKAWSSNTCLSVVPYPQKVTFLLWGDNSWTGLSSYQIESKFKVPLTDKSVLITATCLPLFTLLSALKVKTVDYFVLDVEGSELKVLKTIPFDLVFIRVFTIEYPHMPEGPDALKSFMASKGYLYVRSMEGNAPDFMFVHNSLKDNLHLAL